MSTWTRQILQRSKPLLVAALCAMSGAANAAQGVILPLPAGNYYSDSPEDCGGPAALNWDGKNFGADYVYMDHVTNVQKVGAAQFLLTSRTRTRDGNTRKQGLSWLAAIAILGPTKFTFNQYAAGKSPNPRDARTFTLCGK